MGEAIENQDVFLLAWSKNSEASHFVEFEWCTAIALKKTIVPCLLDDTPLTSSLKAFHWYRQDDATGLIQSLRGAPLADVQRRELVIRTLIDITATEAAAVLAQAKTVFAQQQWTVQGNAYHAGGDIRNREAPIQATQHRRILRGWEKGVALIAGAPTIIVSVFQISDRVWPPQLQASGLNMFGHQSTESMADMSAHAFGLLLCLCI